MKYSALSLTILLLSSCSHFKKPMTLEEAVKMEGTDLSLQKVTSQDELVSFEVPGKLSPTINHISDKVDFYYSTIDIGASYPMECYIYKTDINPASTLKRMSEKVISDKKIVGEIAQKEIALFGAGVALEASPFMLLHTSYLTKDKKVGKLKGMIVVKDHSSAVCLHNDVGFNQTFTESFLKVAASLEVKKGKPSEPEYREVFLLKMNNIPLGFVTNSLIKAQNKTQVSIQRTSLLIPVSASEILSSDGVELEISDAKGMLTYGRYLHDGEPEKSFSIEVKTNDLKTYNVLGMVGEKTIATQLETHGIVSSYGHTKMLPRKLFEQELQQFSIPIYSPSRNPAAVGSLRTSLKSKSETGAVLRIDSGDGATTSEVDLDGTLKRSIIPAGQFELIGERVFKLGTISSPQD
ncbi:hypothetical protein ACJVC5_08250 [Peredibacter sp. HCB2-198]|uniref:hypothetical protein n=1 Tax=Peredibacter sp. HCB2-198 TaxID=3383025 RepID=UPI0038B53E67